MPPLDLERLEGRPEAITEIHSHSAINAMDDYRRECNQSDERRAKLEQEMCCNNAIMQGPPGGKQTSRSHCCFVIVGVVAQLSVLSGGDQADHHHATWDSHTLAGAKVCDGIAQWSSQYWCLVFYIFGLEHRNCPNESHTFVCVYNIGIFNILCSCHRTCL